MATGKKVCKKCGESLILPQLNQKVLKLAENHGLGRYWSFFDLCQKCRAQAFADGLIGDRLEKVDRVKHVARRTRGALQPVKKDTRLGTTVYKSECFICNEGCDAQVHVKDGKVVRVEGDPSSPLTRGTLCCKGLASKEMLYHPDRLLYPLKRLGERGEGNWKRISWDEALETIARRFGEIEKQYGKDSIVLATGTSRGWVNYFVRFANAYGKQWTAPGIAQCLYPRLTGQILVAGGTTIENPHYEQTQCMLIWGCNPTTTHPTQGVRMMEARSRGAKMIVVDPLLTEAASKADLWLQLRPGTDAALALGMLSVIISEGIYNRKFVEQWCFGFKELQERIREYPVERVAKITGVSGSRIREAARLYATIRPASITQRVSIEQNADTISTCRAITILAAITGNIDVPGGNLFSMPKKVQDKSVDSLKKYLTSEHHENRLGNKAYPLLAGKDCLLNPAAHNHSVWQAILTGKPYPVRAVYCQGNNMLVAYGNSSMVRKALTSLDFFVVADLFMTDTTRIADIVLPAATWMERNTVTVNNDTASINLFQLQQKVVEIAECWTDYKILNELAKKLGLEKLMFPTDEAYCDFILEPSGMTFEEFKKIGGLSVPYTFRKYEARGFNTPSRKIQLYDPRLRDLGFDPIPDYREPTESPESTPELAKKYPLIITTGGRVPVFRHSELRNIPILREIVPDLLVSIHPETAKRLGIVNGEQVMIESPRGDMEAKAYLTEGIYPGMVQVPSHWSGRNNVNLLMDNKNCAPMIGSTQLRCQLCRVQEKG